MATLAHATKDGAVLTTAESFRLIEIPKHLAETKNIQFPGSDHAFNWKPKAEGHEQFIFDVNRKGQFRLTKCSYQERYANADLLIRLDVDGRPHVNPDGADVPCPHLHQYREGFELRWAIPAPSELVHSSLVRTLHAFLRFCNVESIPDIQGTIE